MRGVWTKITEAWRRYKLKNARCWYCDAVKGPEQVDRFCSPECEDGYEARAGW